MIKIINLDSGVRLILENMPEVRSSCVGIWCNTGSSNETISEEGISHFIEHMLFKGTDNRSAFQIVDEIDSMGGEINAFTGKESTCFYVKCLDEHLFTACDVLTDMIEHPLFDSAELEREKLVVIEEINMNADDPDDVALDALEQILYHGCGMSHPVLGNKDNIKAFSSAKLRDYYNSHYTRDSIVVSVSGSFDESEVVAYFNKHFNELPQKSRIDDRGVVLYESKNNTIVKDIEQAHICMGIPSIKITDPNRYMLSMLNTILGGGMSSRLFQHVREELGLAYSVYSLTGLYTLAGMFVIYAGVNKDRIDEAIEAIQAELKLLSDNPISEKEYMSAKEQLKSAYIFAQENIKSRMTSNGRNLLALGKCPSQDEILNQIDSISLEDIEKAKSLICDVVAYSTVVVTGK